MLFIKKKNQNKRKYMNIKTIIVFMNIYLRVIVEETMNIKIIVEEIRVFLIYICLRFL